MKGSFVLVVVSYIQYLIVVTGSNEDDFVYNQHCSGPSHWIVQSQKVCYGPDVLEEGMFRIRSNRTIVALRLVHLSGDLTCKTIASNWGCRQIGCVENSCHGTRIQRNSTNEEFPDHHAKDVDGLYTFPGFTIDDDLLIIKLQSWPTKVYDGEIFNVFYQGYRGTGIHCVRADASFLSC